jgi:hypothetical protein
VLLALSFGLSLAALAAMAFWLQRDRRRTAAQTAARGRVAAPTFLQRAGKG